MARVFAQNVIVEFPIYGAKSRSVKHTFIRAATGGLLAKDATDRVVIRAVNKASFELHEGDRMGIVGHNGSGKSTLLRVISGAYEPLSGTIEVSGKVASMLSIAVGMESEATGYENIFLRAAVMGMTPTQIKPLVEEICRFSELGDYMDMPLRTYSSGMSMRLAFAISTSVPADIVLMDEWLSVGDATFTEKAQVRLKRIINQAKILVLASHNEDLIRENCNKLMKLDHGEIVGLDRI